MPYLEKRHRMKNRGKYWIEVEQYFSGMYGNHESRAPKSEMTSEQVEEINQRRAAKQLRRVILLNFAPGDLYLTFTYKRGTRYPPEEAKKHLNRFMNRVKYRYQKIGIPFKWIKTTGLTERGMPHHHVIMNFVEGVPYNELIAKYFPYGRVHIQYLYAEGSYKELAEYFVKHKKENKQVDEKVGVLGYSCSRNLIRSNPKPKIIKESKIRKCKRIPRDFILLDCEEGVTKDGYLYRYYLMEKIEKKTKDNSKGTRKRE